MAFFVLFFALLFLCGLQLFINFLEPNGKHRRQFQLCANVAIIQNRMKGKMEKITRNFSHWTKHTLSGQFNLINGIVIYTLERIWFGAGKQIRQIPKIDCHIQMKRMITRNSGVNSCSCSKFFHWQCIHWEKMNGYSAQIERAWTNGKTCKIRIISFIT